MQAAFFTLGCKVNQYETNSMIQQFSAAGFTIVSTSDRADVYIVNSCTVTAAGDKKSLQILRRFRRQNPQAVICLCGCFPQAFPEEAAKIPEADIVMGSKDRAALLAAVQQRLAGAERLVHIAPHHRGEGFEPMRITDMDSHTRAFVKIQDGCERYCAYCIIPKARGPVRSKPLADITAELADLVAAGYQEVVLVGINLSTYGQELGLTLRDAVEAACAVPGLARVRLGSLEPELLTDEDIAAMAQWPALCPQFHLSLQSGCDTVLARMRRHYDTAEYRRIVTQLRAVFPHCAITTDIMTGFPGETEEEHQASLNFAREIGFARIHVFAYSARPGTTAAKMENQIAEAVKQRRSREMIAAGQQCQQEFFAAQLGQVTSVLFEACEDGLWKGYTANYTPVWVAVPPKDSNQDLSGHLVEVAVTGMNEEACLGAIF